MDIMSIPDSNSGITEAKENLLYCPQRRKKTRATCVGGFFDKSRNALNAEQNRGERQRIAAEKRNCARAQ
ncbi:hypothetical protein [Janthinobacterium sp. LB2P70]|uniref:hypothetical protein n=1 Tax=Janthinobacterium sp. LB2P70 TaxID=3424197 RepID=UPI003F25A51E